MTDNWLQCNYCSGARVHDVFFKERFNWTDDDGSFHSCTLNGYNQYRLLRCRGCENVPLVHESFNDSDGETDRYFYPPPSARPEPKWLAGIGHGWLTDVNKDKRAIGDLLKQVYTAIHNGSRRLSAIGIRAILEHVMLQTVGDHGTFRENILAFRAAGFVSQKDANFLTAVFEAGSASMHRNWEPDKEQVDTLMDVTEHIVETMYVHSEKIDKLTPKVPARPKHK